MLWVKGCKLLLKKSNRICRRYFNYKRYSLKSKLILLYIFLAILPIFLIVLVSYHFYSISIEKQINDLTEYNLIQTSENIQTTLEVYKDLIYSVVCDDEVNRLIGIFNRGNDTQRILAKNSIKENFIIRSYSKWDIRSLIFINNKMEYAGYEKSTPTVVDTIWNDVEHNRYIFEKGYNSDGVVFLPTTAQEYPARKKEYLFHMVMKVKNLITKEIDGVLVLSLQESMLSNICNPGKTPEWQNVLHTYSFITDREGQIISCIDKDYIGKNVKNYVTSDLGNTRFSKERHSVFYRYNSRSVIVNKRGIGQVPWTIINLGDKDTLFSQVNFFKRVVVMLSIFIALVFTAIILAITRHYAKSIRQILNGMKLAQSGQLSVQLELEVKDEFYVIARRFNKMIRQINQLVEEVKKQKEDAYIATYRQKEAEIRALEAQINPHFLYNTLDCINWIAIENEEHEISQMLSKLAQILRYSINKSNNIVMLEEEIKWLKQYVYIQQQRFGHSFECILEIEEKVKKFPIHKLLLQPFIENAIIHGFEGYKTGGVLQVRIKLAEGDCAELWIEDNGNGIKEEVLSKILHSIHNKKEDEAGIGIYNVINRVKMYYGDRAKLEIWSKPGQGTRIYLKIPKMGSDER